MSARRALLLACALLLFPLLSPAHPGGARPDTVAAGRLLVRLEVSDSNGAPFRGTVRLQCVTAKDHVRVSTNPYGLGFGLLLTGVQYAVSVGDFGQFATFRTPGAEASDYTVELTLPSASMAGKLAPQGNGLILFTYKDSVGRPWVNQELEARSSEGMRYRARTDSRGKARLSLPLGDRYSFSVKGLSDFSSHAFTQYPPLQSAEIDLVWGRYSAKTRRPPSRASAVPARNRHDSLRMAEAYARNARRRRPKRGVLLPDRPFRSDPRVSKRVLEGIYNLRTAYKAACAKDSSYTQKNHLEVLRPLQRNAWDSAVFVVDVTCSMDPYVEQYLLWLSMASPSLRPVGTAFFNDGDGRSDAQKPLGAAGGVWVSRGASLPESVDVMLKSISYGCSGMVEENDLEALLVAQRRFPAAKRLVLIADNMSAVRDLALVDSLQRPVHVILCGSHEADVRYAPHPDYLTIAYRTGGSVHTLEEDLPRLQMRLSGEMLRISQWAYRYARGRFTRIFR